MESENIDYPQIVFFDGVCHLCNGFVDFVIQKETTPKKLLFAPLQGETAKNYLSEKEREQLASVVFYDEGQLFREAPAVVRIAQHLPYPWKALSFFAKLFPVKLQNAIYRWVAKNRYAWFGKSETCRLPSPEEKIQFLP